MRLKQLWAIVAMLLVFGTASFAQVKPATKSKRHTPIADSLKAAKDSVMEKLKGSTKIPGLFTIYQDTLTGSAMLYVKKSQLGKEFIYQSFSMGGPASLFLNQNMIRETWVFSIRKKFEKLEFNRVNTNFYYDPSNFISKAANVDVSDAVFFSDKISLKDSGGYYINVDGLFLSDKLDRVKPNFPPALPPASYFNLGQLNTSKSGYTKIRSFPENTDLVVELAYDNPAPVNEGGRDITDARYVMVKMQHSIIEMPKNDYIARRDDPRVGYFTQEINDMTSIGVLNYHDLINRWHLKKKDPTAPLSEPVEPIVWWVENSTPKELQPIVVEAGQKWNKAFEKAGFKNAVIMKIMPDTATWDPADIRYNVIRWVSSDLGYAIGPSFVNPKTGQILGADITIDYGFLAGTLELQDLFETGLQNSPMNIDQQTAAGSYKSHLMNCTLGKGLGLQFDMGKTALDVSGAAPADRDLLLKQFFSFLVLHEMGHTMGLNHNMKSSQMLSPEELTNRSITSVLGVTGSVMDYPVVNLSSDRTKQGDYYTYETGPYDAWAIEYGYSVFAPGEEEKGLKKILSRSTDPKLIFGNDADIVFNGSGIDPRVMVWDMSNDMVSYGTDRFKLVNQMLPKLKERYSRNDQSYHELLSRYFTLFFQRWGMAQSISRYIGGVYVDRSFIGQADGTKPYTPVAIDYQKKAMQTLGTYIFAPNAYDADTYLFPYLQAQRRGFHFFGQTENPKPEQIILSMQSGVLNYLLFPATMQRLSSSTLYGNSYTPADVLKDLSASIFEADLKSDVNLYRQNLQTEYVKKLADALADNRYDHAAKAAVFNTLNAIRTDLKKAASGSEQTKAHRANLQFMIDKALVVK
jgi:hypothetical protein